MDLYQDYRVWHKQDNSVRIGRYFTFTLIVYLYLVKNALQGKLLPFTSAEEQKFVDFNVLNKQDTLTWNDILRKDLNLEIPEEENFFWLDGTAWNYTNFKDFRTSILFLKFNTMQCNIFRKFPRL